MFKQITDKERLTKTQIQTERCLSQQLDTDLVNSIVFVTLAESGSIDEVTASEHTNLFADWVSGVSYTIGAIRQYNEELYRCLQNHTSQEDWTPDTAHSLWVKIGDPMVEYPDWSQPIGAQDAYNIDDKVTHNNKKWISTVDNNVWEPGVYGWNEIIE